MIQFKCQHCGQVIKVADEYGGKKGKCPGCKQVVEVPRPKTESGVGLVPMDDGGSAKTAPHPPAPAAAPKKSAPPAPAKSPAAAKTVPPPAPAKPKPPASPPKDDDEVEAVEVAEDDEEVEAVEEVEEERPRKGHKKSAAREDDAAEEVEEAVEEDQPRRKGKKGKRGSGKWAACPECEATVARKVKYVWWGSALAPALFSIVECGECGTRYNGRTGKSYTIGAIIFLTVIFALFGGALGFAAYMLWLKHYV